MLKRTAALSAAWIAALSCLPDRHHAAAPSPSGHATVVDVKAPPTFVERGAGARAVGPSRTFVWTHDEQGRNTTYELDEAGKVVHEERGIAVASSHGLMHFTAESVPVKTTSCTFEDDTGATVTTFAAESGHRTVAKMVADDGYARTLVDASVASETPSDGDVVAAQFEHGATLVGQVGPYLFLREDSYQYSCGAHGSAFSAAFVYDLEKGERVMLSSMLPSAAPDAITLGERVVVAFAADAEDTPEPDQKVEDATPSAVELLPTFGEGGRLGLDVRYARSTYYAGSSGDWSSYFEAKLVASPSLPSALVSYADAPVPVRSFVATRTKGETVGGWSVLSGVRTPSR